MVIIYLWTSFSAFNKLVKSLAVLSIILNFVYIVLSGSRTTLICLLVVAVLYALMMADWTKKAKAILTIVVAGALVIVSYNSVKYSSDVYLKSHSTEIQKKQRGKKEKKIFHLKEQILVKKIFLITVLQFGNQQHHLFRSVQSLDFHLVTGLS